MILFYPHRNLLSRKYIMFLFFKWANSFCYWFAGKCLQTNSLEKNFKVLFYGVCAFLWYKHSTIILFKLSISHWMQSWEEKNNTWSLQACTSWLQFSTGFRGGKVLVQGYTDGCLLSPPSFHYRQSSNWSENLYLQKQKCLYICKAKHGGQGPQLGGNSHPCIQAEEGATPLPHGPHGSLCLLCSAGSVLCVKSFWIWEQIYYVCLNNTLALPLPKESYISQAISRSSAPTHNTCHNRKSVSYTIIPKHIVPAHGEWEQVKEHAGWDQASQKATWLSTEPIPKPGIPPPRAKCQKPESTSRHCFPSSCSWWSFFFFF